MYELFPKTSFLKVSPLQTQLNLKANAAIAQSDWVLAANAYEKLKSLTRGETVDRVSIKLFIESLRLTQPHEEKLLSLSPKKYIGLAPKIANRI